MPGCLSRAANCEPHCPGGSIVPVCWPASSVPLHDPEKITDPSSHVCAVRNISLTRHPTVSVDGCIRWLLYYPSRKHGWRAQMWLFICKQQPVQISNGGRNKLTSCTSHLKNVRAGSAGGANCPTVHSLLSSRLLFEKCNYREENRAVSVCVWMWNLVCDTAVRTQIDR